MQIKKVGKRGTLFTFYDLLESEFECTTNVYLINGNKYIFICDTFLGPESMREVNNYIDSNIGEKPIIIFNSHSDWDHIWGNCFFSSSIIISHQLCREMVEEEGERYLKKYEQFYRGKVKIVLPNVTFQDKISFPEEGIEFYYSPGHTIDSCTCYDMVDQILYVGDNVEDPIPYLSSNLMDEYQSSMVEYINKDVKLIIPGHGDVTTKELVKRNINYIQNFISGTVEFGDDEKFNRIHEENLTTK
ncbi:MAG: MBL fold metallo-hydrolase [Halanaerobiales bacterium]|nr:MBL fold metallo-hydrolase [Halanaerobiales bacterium]